MLKSVKLALNETNEPIIKQLLDGIPVILSTKMRFACLKLHCLQKTHKKVKILQHKHKSCGSYEDYAYYTSFWVDHKRHKSHKDHKSHEGYKGYKGFKQGKFKAIR